MPINGRIAADLSASNTAAAFTADYLDNEEAAKAHETAKRELKKLVSGEHREVRVGALVMRRDARGAIRFSRCEPDALHPGQPAAA